MKNSFLNTSHSSRPHYWTKSIWVLAILGITLLLVSCSSDTPDSEPILPTLPSSTGFKQFEKIKINTAVCFKNSDPVKVTSDGSKASFYLLSPVGGADTSCLDQQRQLLLSQGFTPLVNQQPFTFSYSNKQNHSTVQLAYSDSTSTSYLSMRVVTEE